MATTPQMRVRPLDRLWVLLATGLGSGFFPFAPATFASLLVTAAYGLIAPAPGRTTFLAVLALAAAIFVIGVPLSRRTETLLGPDARPIVIDEVAGQLIALAGLPPSLPVLAAGFLLFRVADVVKIPPAGAAERLPNGLGVMADDVVAGVYAHLALRAVLVLTAG